MKKLFMAMFIIVLLIGCKANSTPDFTMSICLEGSTDTLISEKDIESFRREKDKITDASVLSVKLNPEATVLFEQLTMDNIGTKIELYINGKLVSTVRIQEPIPTGELRIAYSGE